MLSKWSSMTHTQRVGFLRSVAEEYGRDPLLAQKAGAIVRGAGVAPRDYPGTSRALLAYVQRSIHYVNEQDERIQSPWVTLESKVGDCDDMAVLLCSLATSIGIPNRYVLIGRDRRTGRMVRWVEGTPMPRAWNKPHGGAVDWIHVACALGWPFGAAPSQQRWAEAEPTLRGAPLGYSIVRHGVQSDGNGWLSLPSSFQRPTFYKGLPPSGADVQSAGTGGGVGSSGGQFLGRLGGVPVPGFAGSGSGLDSGNNEPPPERKPYWRRLGVDLFEAALGGVATFAAVALAQQYIGKKGK